MAMQFVVEMQSGIPVSPAAAPTNRQRRNAAGFKKAPSIENVVNMKKWPKFLFEVVGRATRKAFDAMYQ